MSPASPSSSPSGKPSVTQRAKNFFRKPFLHSHVKSTSKTANASTPTLVYGDTGNAAGERDSHPRVSLNDLRTPEQAMSGPILTSSVGVGASSLLVPGRVLANMASSQNTMDTPMEPHNPTCAAILPDFNATAQTGPAQSSTLKENAKVAWHGFKLAAKTAEAFVDGTPFKIPIAVVNKVFDLADGIIDNKESMAELLLPLGQRLNVVSTALTQKHLVRDIQPTLKRFSSTLEETTNKLQDMYDEGLFKRILQCDEHPKELADIFRRVDEATKNFQLELNLANFKQVNTVKNDVEVSRLHNLRPIFEARYGGLDRNTCTPGTREDIIKDIISWCKDTSRGAPSLYWLSGMAGTGKSTIAATICQKLDEDGDASRLATSFFCSRQSEAGRKRSNIIPTIAHGLALRLPRFRRAVLDAQLDANPPELKHHLRDLLTQPCDMSIGDREGLPPLVVVIDALDELENSDGSSFLEDLIREIAKHPDNLPSLKFFVTSRPDPSIVEIGKTLSSDTVFCLEEVPIDIANKDINTYLEASLPRLPLDQLHCLTEQTSGLFIYAATVVRMIIPDRRQPPAPSMQKKQLQALLNAWPGKSQCAFGGSLIDHLYEDILRQYFCGRNMTELHQKSSLSVLHTVLCAQEPIQVSDIPQLWANLDLEEDAVLEVVQSLHSVLYIKACRVYSYHKSFLDFMFDVTRFVDQELAAICCPPPDLEFHLAASCFRLMKSLRFNICNLPSSFLNDSEVDSLSADIESNISSSLTYACRHWAAHLVKIPTGAQNIGQDIIDQMQDWLYGRVVFWMEAMNLLGVVGECYHALVAARRWLGPDQVDICKNLTAAENLVAIFGMNIIRDSTPHLYISALAGASRDSDLIERWHTRFPRVPTIVSILRSGRLLSRLQHNSGVRSVAFSSDGSRAISGSDDTTIRIWDVSTGKQLQQLDGHDNTVNSVAFSSDGSRAISGSDDRTIRIWDVSTGKQLQQLDGHNDCVRSVAFSSDGSRAISGSDDRTIRIWDVSTGKQLQQLDRHDNTVNSVAFSSDGSRAISGSNDRTIRIWDVSTRKQLQQLDGHDDWVCSVAFSSDGSRAISGSDDRTIRIWDVSTGKQLQQLDRHDNTVNSVAFSSDGSRAISGSDDRTIRIWDVSTGNQLQQLDGHDNTVNSVAFSSDGSRAISGSDDRTIRIWDVSTRKQLQQLDGHDDWVCSVAFSSDGSCAISGSNDTTIRIWDVSTGNQRQQLDGHDNTVNSVAFSSDGLRAISGSHDSTIRIWDVSTGKQLQQLDGHDDCVRSVAFSSDGSRAISGSDDRTIRIWDVSTGKQLQQLDRHDNTVNSVAFSSDGLRAISGSDDRTIRIWDVSTGKQLQQLDGHDNWVLSVAFSSDGSHAISGSIDTTIHIWDVSTGKQLQQLDGHNDCVRSVAFSSDGSRAISGSDDRTIRIWDVSTGKQLQQLDRHDNTVNSVAFSSDGLRAISGSDDRTIRIWDVSTRKQLQQLDGHDDWVCSVAFSSDGSCAISGSDDRTIRTWQLPLSDSLKTDWNLDRHGWITSSTNQRLIWLPFDMCPFLNTPKSLVISAWGSVKVDFSDACLGSNWVQCYDSQVT
ncbi:WD40-repeat-containing domain protein [Mycena albidolilacea]|uniref:WD40-repeat-containing domain protein n=1 Tax=Mycena albidolilacea TaxID=1033008 RepID=A0AAD6Z4K4_9AGAR|nr:WD40-repeat-containing domain protein [Mycena albidolilacea]